MKKDPQLQMRCGQYPEDEAPRAWSRCDSFPGDVPKPSIWADPGPIVTKGSPVTIWCQGSLQAEAYLLYKDRGSEPWETRIPQDSNNKAGFLTEARNSHHAGLYQCAYYTTGDILSERSDPLLLVVTGVYPAPSLSAQPSPVVASGGNLSLSCSSQFTSGHFHLLKEGGADPPQHMEAEPRMHAGRWQAIFPLGPVSPSHGGTYRCYGSPGSYPNVWSQPSAPLLIDVTGPLPKPTLWAESGPMIALGSSVTIICQGTTRAKKYRLHKEGNQAPWKTQNPQEPGDKAKFSVTHMTERDAGRYRCYYYSPAGWSEPSDSLELVVTGVVPKPSIWAEPGPIVTNGSSVTIWCQGSLQGSAYVLYKERGSEPLDTRTPQDSSNKAGFLIEATTPSHARLYQCAYHTTGDIFSELSDPLLLVVTGVHREPTLSAQPGSLVLPGHSLTLQCHAEAGFDTFALTKDEELKPPHRLHGQHSPDFPLGHVNGTHGGRYRCYSGHHLSSVWSAPSAPLDILVAGMYTQPYLSAQPGPSVPREVNVTLQCGSEIWFDTFHLHRVGSLDPPQHLHLQDTSAPSQATFTLSPLTSGHQGTYRCYGSRSTSPYLLSHPSAPLELVVSDYTVENLIRMGVAGLVLVVLGVLLFQARNDTRRTLNAARM
ncbi:Leukocyte immunoglobulin-like receptor subfamily A member 6 [Myotis brandtii]|nr:Leukocyte immunoglobulin-like receptor subfamily A member 6 [Myotis brandtii]